MRATAIPGGENTTDKNSRPPNIMEPSLNGQQLY